MSKYSKKCGTNATDDFDDYYSYKSDNRTIQSRSHYIYGSGSVTSCYANSSSWSYEESYSITSGITELEDSCLSKGAINSVSLPNTLIKIGNKCLYATKITSISLPNSLEIIGESNFPSSLSGTFTIPPKIKTFPISNLSDCSKVSAIKVHADSKSYKSIDGVLYNFELTEVILCPRGKEGQVFVVDGVKKVGPHCFDGCRKLTSIVLPNTVETIGECAFKNLELDNLIIPNSVTSISMGCFMSTLVRKKFRLSKQITAIPAECFHGSNIKIETFPKNIKSIGYRGFFGSKALPKRVVLDKIEYLGSEVFYDVTSTEEYVIGTTLRKAEQEVFGKSNENLKIVYMSYEPRKVHNELFKEIGKSSTLYIPKGSKFLYGNELPWCIVPNIVEIGVEQDTSDLESFVTDEEQAQRLLSLQQSVQNADHDNLKHILSTLSLSFYEIESDEEYDEALNLFSYNNRFSPAIIPSLELSVTRSWPNKYKLRYLRYCIVEKGINPFIEIEDSSITNNVLTSGEPVAKMLDVIEPSLLSAPKQDSVEVYFEDILDKLIAELESATKSIKVAVSWFTNYTLFKLLKEKALDNKSIELVINNDLINCSGYCLKFSELIEAGVKISLVENPHLLHHKFCIIDDRIVINGSYNWTRFSSKNYENITIFRGNDDLCSAYIKEFDRILQVAEHKCVQTMPLAVPGRPEYDRSAFRQYITEELDAEARETSDTRDKITALHKAAKVNPEYFDQINPTARKQYSEEFKVLDQADSFVQDTVAIISQAENKDENSLSVSSGSEADTSGVVIEKKETTSSTESVVPSVSEGMIVSGPKPLIVSSPKSEPKIVTTSGTSASSSTVNTTIVTKDIEEKVAKVSASSLYMVLDVSGSMQKTFSEGHATALALKAVSASLNLTENKSTSLWTFSSDAKYVCDVTLANLNKINEVKCTSGGTELVKFVNTITSNVKDGSLVIILTDDDSSSIKTASEKMKAKSNVFWQVIAYGASFPNISNAIKEISNISLACLTDYASKSDKELNELLIGKYISWKLKHNNND